MTDTLLFLGIGAITLPLILAAAVVGMKKLGFSVPKPPIGKVAKWVFGLLLLAATLYGGVTVFDNWSASISTPLSPVTVATTPTLNELWSEYGPLPFSYGWQEVPTCVRPEYTLTADTGTLPAYSGLDVTLGGGYVEAVFPEGDEYGWRRLWMGTPGSMEELHNSPHKHKIVTYERLYLTGKGKSGDILCATMSFLPDPWCVRIATRREATLGTSYRWGHLPSRQRAEWKLSVRVTKKDGTPYRQAEYVLPGNTGGKITVMDSTQRVYIPITREHTLISELDAPSDEPISVIITAPGFPEGCEITVIARLEEEK